MKTILVLPGSKWQVPLVEKIKEMGNRVVVVSPEKDAPCFAIADDYLRVNIFAIDDIQKYAIKKRVDAILSDECDIAVPVIAELGERLHLSTISKSSAELFTNKFLMRKFCKECGVKYPEYRLCYTVDNVVSFLGEIKRPLIIKPLDSNASHGVFLVENENDARKHFMEAVSFSKSKKALLAERYIEGTEFTIDGIKTPEHHYTLAISEKRHFAHNSNIANELFFTHYNDKYNYDRLRNVNDKFILKSDLKYGFTHAEYKYEEGEFYLIEVAARGGGNEISSLITQYMSGQDTYKYLVECSLGNFCEKDFSISPQYTSRSAVLYFFKTPTGGGRVKAIYGEDILKDSPCILDYALNFKVGDQIKDAINDSARIGFYIAGKSNIGELRQLMSEVNEKFCIEVE